MSSLGRDRRGKDRVDEMLVSIVKLVLNVQTCDGKNIVVHFWLYGTIE